MSYDEKRMRKHREAMTRGEAVPVSLETYEGKRSEGTIRLKRLSEGERRARGRKWLITFLLAAPVSVVCPPHIPWPFVMVGVGVIGARLRRGHAELVLAGEAHCPKCDAFQIIDPANAEFPLAHFCSECDERILVRPVPPPSTEDAGRPEPAKGTESPRTAAPS